MDGFKTLVNGILSKTNSVEKKLTDLIDKNQSTNKSYIDEQITENKTYFDGQIEDNKSYIDGQIVENKTYIDGQLVENKTYFESQIETLNDNLSNHDHDDEYADIDHVHDYNEIQNTPVLANGNNVEVIAKDQIKIGDVVYTVNNSELKHNDALDLDFGDSTIDNLAFSNDGKLLIINSKVYSVEGTTITYISDIYSDNNGTVLSGVTAAAFSPDNKLLVLSVGGPVFAKLYSVNDSTITYISDIYADNGTTTISGPVNTVAFSPDGKLLALGGYFSNWGKLYSVSNNTITYISDIKADNEGTSLPAPLTDIKFSPDSKLMIICGMITMDRVKVYSVDSDNKTIMYIGGIYTVIEDSNTTETIAFSPDGKLLVLGGAGGLAKLYSVSNNNITYISNIYADNNGTVLDSSVSIAVFSPDGKLLVLGGYFSGYGKLYSVSNNNITYISDIYSDNGTTLSSYVRTIAFSPDGKLLVLGGNSGLFESYIPLSPYAYLSTTTPWEHLTYSVGIAQTDMEIDENGTVQILEERNNTVIKSYVDEQVDNVNNKLLTHYHDYNEIQNKPVLANGNNIEVVAKNQIKIGDVVYTVKSDVEGYDYISDIYSDNNNTAFSNYVITAAFSPDGSLLVLGGQFTGRAKLYSVNNNNITYISDIYADNNGSVLYNIVEIAAFSPDGKLLVVGGHFTGYGKLYSIEGTTVTYISDLYTDNNNTKLSGYVYRAAFSPDGKLLVLGGGFGGVKLYSVDSNNITYISDIYADNNNTKLSGNKEIITFSPDGKLLVLGGTFAGYGKLYSVNDTTITYISDIYADNEDTVLDDYVYTAAFSPDGSLLVLGGTLTSKAKLYSVSNNNITYISDIHVDDNDDILSIYVKSIAFSPDGKLLVLGGKFSGYSKLYSVNDTTITYISDIYADNEDTVLDDYIYTVAFSPDGSLLVLGGYFTGYTKSYLPLQEFYSYLSTITPWNHLTYSVGIAQTDMEVDGSGTVKILEERNGIANKSYVDEQVSNINTELSSHTHSYNELEDLPALGDLVSKDEITESELGSDLLTKINSHAPLDSPALSGTPTAPTAAVGNNSTQIATTAFVQSAINGVLTSEITFKGATSTLPASPINGDMYKVSAVINKTSNMDRDAVINDTIIYNSSDSMWYVIPSGDDIEDTWRAIQVNGGSLLTGGTTTGALNLKNGNGIILTGSGNAITFSHNAYTPRTSGLYKITVDDTGHITEVTPVSKEDITGLGIPAQDTVYTQGTGISISGTTINNSGVRSIETGSTNGTISVDIDGTSSEVVVKGLGTAAYTDSSAYAPAHVTRTVTLTASGWTASDDMFIQSVNVSGVSSDEIEQLITITPKISSQAEYIESGVYASDQAINSITFTCSEIPTTDLTVYVVIQEV